jgi:hypothetical protein
LSAMSPALLKDSPAHFGHFSIMGSQVVSAILLK